MSAPACLQHSARAGGVDGGGPAPSARSHGEQAAPAGQPEADTPDTPDSARVLAAQPSGHPSLMHALSEVRRVEVGTGQGASDMRSAVPAAAAQGPRGPLTPRRRTPELCVQANVVD